MKTHNFIVLFLACLILFLQACNQNDETRLEPKPSSSSSLFQKISPQKSNIHFQNTIPEDARRNVIMFEYFYHGAGVGIGDFNADGLPDIYLVGNMVNDKLYINQGDFKFKDMTLGSGLNAKNGWSFAVSVVDINQDGLDDIYVTRGGESQESLRGNLLYVNQGDLRFKESSVSYGLHDTGYSTACAFFDADADGDLDMYQCNTPREISKQINVAFSDKASYSWKLSDKLYINNGQGKFTENGQQAGLKPENAYGLGVTIGDLNQDQLPDIYVSNDYDAPDYLYINQGNGKFKEQLSKYINHCSNNSMGCSIEDINNDGLEDIMVVDMLSDDYYRSKTMMATMNVRQFWKTVANGGHYQYMQNTLQLNRGNGRFSEIAYASKIAKSDWSWGPLIADFDQDGYQDIFITNGIMRDLTNNDFRLYIKKQQELGSAAEQNMQNILNQIPSTKIKNRAFRNTGDLSFNEVSSQWGLDHAGFSAGSAYADFDGDGDLDLVVSNLNESAMIYKNQSNQNFLKIKFLDPKIASGTKIYLYNQDQIQLRSVHRDNGYFSTSDPSIYFGLGQSETIDSLAIYWSDGRKDLLKNVKSNKTLLLNPSNMNLQYDLGNAEKWFVEINSGLHIHNENQFDDFANEILAPQKLSQEGPKLCLSDINGDGTKDIIIPGPKGQYPIVLNRRMDGTINQSKIKIEKAKFSEVIQVIPLSNNQYLMCIGGNDEERSTAQLNDLIVAFDNGHWAIVAELDDATANNTALVFDIDKDNKEEIIILGRNIPGDFGLPSDLKVYQEKDKKWEVKQHIEEIGLITDAIFSDHDHDGDNDLIVVGHWMEPTIYLNDNGIFSNGKPLEYQSKIGIKGMWNAIESIDINNDKQADFILGNVGLNNKFTDSLHLDIGDFDNSGSKDILLSYVQSDAKRPVRGRQCLSWQMPNIESKYSSYHSFATATSNDIIDQNKLAKQLELSQRQSGILISSPTGYIFKPFETILQFSPIQDILVNDLNNDLLEDIILVGNFYPNEVETGRFDAGVGNILLNDGNGVFEYLSPKESGFYADKDARSVKYIQEDGLEMIVVGNNNGPVQFFKRKKPDHLHDLAQ